MRDPDRLEDNQTKVLDSKLSKNNAFKEIARPLHELLSSGEKSNGAPFLVFPSQIKDSQDLPSEDLKNTYIVKIDKIVRDDGEKIQQYTTGNLMGFFGKDGHLLVIGSRFAENAEDDFFLYHMLNKVLRFNLTNMKPSYGEDGPAYVRLLEFLLPHYLNEAVRHGVYKEYVRREYNDSHVRGVIVVPRFIRRDVPFVGKVAYNTREFSYDNPVTQLVRHTIEYLDGDSLFSGLMKGPDVRKAVRAIRDATPSYRAGDRRKVIATNERRPVTSRYFSDYLTLQHICLDILRGRGVSMRGEKDKVYGVLFDGAWLWEEYLNCLLKEHSRTTSWNLYHPRNKTKELKQHLFGDQERDDQERDDQEQACYPDFFWNESNGDKFVIMDAKYKPIGNIRRDDYLQILAYMYRFNKSPRGAFLYPESNGKERAELCVRRGAEVDGGSIGDSYNREDYVYKIGLQVPSAKDADAFRDEMANSEKDFCKSLFRLLN